MKKRCIPENNAINIIAPVTCTTPVVPVPEACVDPLTYTWNLAIAKSIAEEIAVDVALTQILTGGLILPKGDGICCPDCSEAPLYAISKVSPFIIMAQALGWTNINNNPIIDYCCINISANMTGYTAYADAMQIAGELPVCCDNNFSACLSQLSSIIDVFSTASQTAGIVETNTLNGDTGVCKLYDLFNSIEYPVYLSDDIDVVFGNLLSGGFVAYCCGCNIVIGTVDVFVDYAQSGLCPDMPAL